MDSSFYIIPINTIYTKESFSPFYMPFSRNFLTSKYLRFKYLCSLIKEILFKNLIYLLYYIVLSRIDKLEYVLETYIKITKLSSRTDIFGVHLLPREIVIIVTPSSSNIQLVNVTFCVSARCPWII